MQFIDASPTSIKSSIISNFEPILYDPGIPGFVRGHRHRSGPAVVMTNWEEGDRDWVAVFWVKRLHHQASPICTNKFWLWTEKTLKAAERAYDLLMMMGPPIESLVDFQRERVYKWEEKIIFPVSPQILTWEECNDFLYQVWRKHGKGSIPELTNQMKYKHPISFRERIHLPCDDPECWTKPILLHEIAHQIEFPAQHGSRFIACYINLCVRFLNMNLQYLHRTADYYEVRY